MLYPLILNEHQIYAELAEHPKALEHLFEICSVAVCVGSDGVGYLALADHKAGNYYLYTLFPTDQQGVTCAGPCGGEVLRALVAAGELDVAPEMVNFVVKYLGDMKRQQAVERALEVPLTEVFFSASLAVGASFTVDSVSLGYGPVSSDGQRHFGLIIYFKVNEDDFDEAVLEEVYDSAKKQVQRIITQAGWVMGDEPQFTVVAGYRPSLFFEVRVNPNRYQQQRALLQ